MITSADIREKFLSFFESKGHARIPSSSVVPENDPTALFIGAGMQPIVPYLAGEPHPAGARLCDVQKCIRTTDIDEVGDDTHLTFFEMLGNWSLGDYFKDESIEWSYELLTSANYLNIDPTRLAVTCYQGNEQYGVEKDTTSYDKWRSLGIPEERIAYLGDDDNWWPKMGMDGLCGPDTEIFYWVPNTPAPAVYDPEDENWVEIWNNVFMQYRFAEGNIAELENKNVDTGMGLERILVALNGKKDIYETDVFEEALAKIEEFSGKKYEEEALVQAFRIICDHVRCGTIMMSDGVRPSNVDQGYILRRLLRRAIRQGKKLEISGAFTAQLAEVFIEKLATAYPNLETQKSEILKAMVDEEEKFGKTLDSGMKEFTKIIKGFEIAFERSGKKITRIAGSKAFKLYDTYGFPIEMTKDLAEEHGFTVDEEGFEKAYKEHQEKSRAGSEKKFEGGLADHGVETTRLHTATHLLLAGLRKVLGDHVHQAGSNITAERLRFDFTHPEKVAPEQLAEVEKYVNDAIVANATMKLTEMNKDAAKADGVEGSFWEKYPDTVKVYSFADASGVVYSKELCGGPHAETTGELEAFKIKKEQSSSSGVRRIKAVIGVQTQ